MAQVKSTPIRQTTPLPPTDSPGNWRHPRLAEITRRQGKTVFSEKNARQIAYNIGAMAVLKIVQDNVLPVGPASHLSVPAF